MYIVPTDHSKNSVLKLERCKICRRLPVLSISPTYCCCMLRGVAVLLGVWRWGEGAVERQMAGFQDFQGFQGFQLPSSDNMTHPKSNSSTLPETNITPENGWFPNPESPFPGGPYFQGTCFREGNEPTKIPRLGGSPLKLMMKWTAFNLEMDGFQP